MRIDDLIPVIVILLIIFVSLVKALIQAASAAKRGAKGTERPSLWQEFKKALEQMAEEQRQAEVESYPEGGPPEAESPTTGEPRPMAEEVIIVTPTRGPRRRRVEVERVQLQPKVEEVSAQPVPHRPEDLGREIEKEVADIVYRPIAARLKEEPPAAPVAEAPMPPSPGVVLRLINASAQDLRKAIILQEILSGPLADRIPGPLGTRW